MFQYNFRNSHEMKICPNYDTYLASLICINIDMADLFVELKA